MGIEDGESGSGDTRFAGTTTGQVHVGRYILDVQSPGGTTLSVAPRGARTDPPSELTAALAEDTAEDTQDPAVKRGFAERANQLLDSAEAVTDKVERATGTVQALLEGRLPNSGLISEDLIDLLGLLRRLDQSERFAEVIKLGRPLCRLFTLTLRWAALVESLRLVLHAATALADTPTIASAQHELGTLHGSVGDVDRARDLLNQARATREAIGDEQGLAATDHNLKVLSRRAIVPSSTATLVGAGIVALVVAVLVFAETVSGGSSSSSRTRSTTATTSHSSTTASTSRSSTTSHSSSDQTGSPRVSITPAEVRFDTSAPGTTSGPRTITLVNGGQGPQTITSVNIIGQDPTDFTISPQGCSGRTLAPQNSCTVAVTFTPAAVGSWSASVRFVDTADPAIQQVSLVGAAATAPRAIAHPREVPFGPTPIGETVENKAELVDNGPSPLAVTSAQVVTGSEFTIESDLCTGQTVAAGASCVVTVAFTPTAAGDATGTLTFTDDADPPTQEVELVGSGQTQSTSDGDTTTSTSSASSTTTQPVTTP
jgi:hypothetical protein